MKIVAFTGIRSDYDLMSGLYRRLVDDSEIDLRLIVTGAHLSTTYGHSVQFIEKDGLSILARIETLLDSDSLSARVKSAAISLMSAIPFVEEFRPDLIVYPGDREDVLVGAIIGAYLGIPTLHFFGGDHAIDGNVDNPVRHAATKLSSVHFVTREEHRQRIIRMGEAESRCFVVGNPALDRFRLEPRIPKSELLEQIGCPGWDSYALVIYHPILGYEDKSADYFGEILKALEFEGVKAVVGYPNIDAGSRSIIQVIDKWEGREGFCFYRNLSRSAFINLMRQARIMVGNSSAGLLEAPIVPLAVVNVGERQKGRAAGRNVVFVDQGIENIRNGIRLAHSPEFQAQLQGMPSPYGDGFTVERCYKLIKSIDFNQFVKKTEDPLLL